MVRRPRTSSAKATKAAPRGKILKLSDDAEKLLDAANDASGPAKNAWIAFLALVTYLLVTLGGVSRRSSPPPGWGRRARTSCDTRSRPRSIERPGTSPWSNGRCP